MADYYCDETDPWPGEEYDAAGVECWNKPYVAQCACGKGYYFAQWEHLPLVGTMRDIDGGTLELRNCSCGSTPARKLP